MLLKRIYDDNLAQASYLIGCAATGEAIVIDPNRDVQQYVRAAEDEDLRITHVTETHIHADFVSVSRELAKITGAKLLLSSEGGPDWLYAFAGDDGATLVRDGDTTISSTYVRSCVDAGDVVAAARALGREHRVEGVVVRGDRERITARVRELDVLTTPDLIYPHWVGQR